MIARGKRLAIAWTSRTRAADLSLVNRGGRHARVRASPLPPLVNGSHTYAFVTRRVMKSVAV